MKVRIWLLLVGFLTGLLGSWSIAQFGSRIGMIDIPNNRSSHSIFIPKGAGIGIVLAFLMASLSLSLPSWLWGSAICISLISFLGGDKSLLSAEKRLVVQFGCSWCLLLYVLNQTPVSVASLLMAILSSVFIVGTSNLYNFMDGIDGLAGITSVVGFYLLWLYIHLFKMDPSYGVLCLVLISSSIGFLCFNLPQAKVFLGDVGSVFLGFIFSCLVILLSDSFIDFIVMIGFISPFYFDELITVILRLKQGDSLVIPHRKHLYQLLANELEVRHWKIAGGYGFCQLLIGLSGIYLKSRGVWVVLLVYLGYGVLFLIFFNVIRKKVCEL